MLCSHEYINYDKSNDLIIVLAADEFEILLFPYIAKKQAKNENAAKLHRPHPL